MVTLLVELDAGVVVAADVVVVGLVDPLLLAVVVVWLVEPLLLVVVVAVTVLDTLAVVRLRESAGSFPLINVIAITSHAVTNRTAAAVSTLERISRVRCALVMPGSFGYARRNSVCAG